MVVNCNMAVIAVRDGGGTTQHRDALHMQLFIGRDGTTIRF